MGKCNTLSIIFMVMAAALFWGVGQSLAEPQETAQQTAITAPFRDPASVPLRHATTSAQREEAARMAAEYRARIAQGGTFKNVTTPLNSTVAPKAKGGPNE